MIPGRDLIIQTAESILKGGVVFFGGAGVSTESGIPDFRSGSGLYSAGSYSGYAPEQLLSGSMLRLHPELFFSYYRENLIYKDAAPNAAHFVLAKWEKAGLLTTVITQNIDGLHQAAGSENVLELHGSNHKHYCVDCKNLYDLDYTLSPGNIKSGIPVCSNCGGMVRPAVTLYEESLDQSVLADSADAILNASTLIAGGTSLTVWPAAGLLKYYRGTNLIIINKSATPYDDSARAVIREPIAKTFEEILRIMDKL